MVCMCGGGGREEYRFVPETICRGGGGGVTEVILFAQTLVPFGLLFIKAIAGMLQWGRSNWNVVVS